MAPRKLPLEITRTEYQLNNLKSEMSQNKGWKAKLKEVFQIVANAARYRDRAQSLDNKSKSNFKHTTNAQTPSQNCIKSLKDGDKMMQDVSKSLGSKNHVDIPQQQSSDSQQRGQQQDRRPLQLQSRPQSQSNFRDQSQSSQGQSQSNLSQCQGRYPQNKGYDSNSQNKPKYNRDYQHRSQSQDNRPPQQQAEQKIAWREPKLYVSGNRHYYDCSTCATAHTADVICIKSLESEN